MVSSMLDGKSGGLEFYGMVHALKDSGEMSGTATGSVANDARSIEEGARRTSTIVTEAADIFPLGRK